MTSYHSDMTLGEAVKKYFVDNNFGDDGGYSDRWVEVKLGPIPVYVPNTPQRVRAVRYHDLHHVLSGYKTDLAGEFEISAWELASWCEDMYGAWWLNLGGLIAGLMAWPRRTVAASPRRARWANWATRATNGAAGRTAPICCRRWWCGCWWLRRWRT